MRNAGSVRGGIRGSAGLDIVDVGEYNNTSDGRIRASEIFSRISNPLSLFEFNGSIDAFLRAIVKIGINLGFFRVERTIYDEELATVQLFEFSLGGDRSGTVSQSYIEGAQVFWDANLNGIRDEGEPFTYTDSNGDYDLDIPLVVFDTNQNGQLDNREGHFVAIGGIDTSSRLVYSSPFYGFSNWGVITPLTTLTYQIWELGSTPVPQASQLVLQAFGLADADIDLSQFDPIEAMDEGDVNGVEVYATHIKVQSMLELTNTFFTEFLEAGGITPNRAELSEAVIEIFAKQIIDNPNPDIWTDSEALLESYTALLTELIPSADELPNGYPISEEDLNTAFEVWSEVVATVFDVVEQEITKLDIDAVLEGIVPTKTLVQEDLVNLISSMGNGTSTPQETLAVLDELRDDIIDDPITEEVVSFGTTGDDILDAAIAPDFDGIDDLLFAGSGNDLIDTTSSIGGNRLYGGSGDDTFFLGDNNRAFGGSGDDTFYLLGDLNVITGGMGADQFWLTLGEVPNDLDTITDFEIGVDTLGIGGLGVSFEDLTLTQQGNDTLITSNGEELGLLLGIQANQLNENDFTFG